MVESHNNSAVKVSDLVPLKNARVQRGRPGFPNFWNPGV
jgi:hypothetical protein